jgi:hypothetical protein
MGAALRLHLLVTHPHSIWIAFGRPERCLACSASMIAGITDGRLRHLRLDAMQR